MLHCCHHLHHITLAVVHMLVSLAQRRCHRVLKLLPLLLSNLCTIARPETQLQGKYALISHLLAAGCCGPKGWWALDVAQEP